MVKRKIRRLPREKHLDELGRALLSLNLLFLEFLYA